LTHDGLDSILFHVQRVLSGDVRPRWWWASLVSAGGLAAFRSFFDHMPADTGMAFVLVTRSRRGT
jgi:chemotaxis response regulator CheB